MGRIRSKAGVAAGLAVVAVASLSGGAVWAHEIPTDVTVLVFVRPAADRLLILVRMPLQAMRDFDFPVRGPGYLELDSVQPVLRNAAKLWVAGAIRLFEEGAALPQPEVVAVRVSLPSDRSFGSFDGALAHVTGPPLAFDTDLVREQALLDVLMTVSIISDRSAFSMATELARLGMRTTTVLRFQLPGGAERAFQYGGDPGLVRLDPRWHQAAWRFVALGFWHILDGVDHLLFLLCLVVPYRRLSPLVGIVTSFTVAHSITLIASAFGLAPGALWFPPLIETLIALSIVYMALENIFGPRLRRRWVIAFAFGLVHGFGFSFALRETLQFGGSHLITSLLAFNVGVEIGQLLVVALALPALNLLFKHVVAERLGTIVLSAFLAHSAWHWMSERWAQLREYRFTLPALDALFVASLMRWLMLALIVGGALWLLSRLVERLGHLQSDGRGTVAAEDR